eukprot:2588540-Amphidinium_carterae.2
MKTDMEGYKLHAGRYPIQANKEATIRIEDRVRVLRPRLREGLSTRCSRETGQGYSRVQGHC